MAVDPLTPWSWRVSLADVSRGPVRLTLQADEAQRAAVAAELDIVRVDRLEGEATVSAWLDGLQVDARWRADATQTCGVTLEPFDDRFSGEFQVRAVPADSPLLTPDSPDVEIDLSTPDPPDVLQADSVDVASLLIEHLALELPAFPRAPGAAFQPPEPEPEVSPFAALAALKRPQA